MNDMPEPQPSLVTAAPPPPTELKTSFTAVRCHSKQKARWVKAAGGRKLSRWITKTLDAAADLVLGPR